MHQCTYNLVQQQSETTRKHQELQSFLGTVNYLSKFLAFLSDLHAPLQGLLKKDAEFNWTETHTQAFNHLKECVSLDISLQFLIAANHYT